MVDLINWYIKKKECVNKCEEDETYKYEFNKRCYKQCSDIPLNQNLKIYPPYKQCVSNCNETDHKYEYNNICYNECPNKKYTKENKYLCLDEKPEG